MEVIIKKIKKLSWLSPLLLVAFILSTYSCSILEPVNETEFRVTFKIEGQETLYKTYEKGSTVEKPSSESESELACYDSISWKKDGIEYQFNKPENESFTLIADAVESTNDAPELINDSYLICNSKQLQWIADDDDRLTKNYLLGKNFVMTESFTPIGSEYNPFKGIFDGNRKTISNFFIRYSHPSYIGLFGKISSGQVKNLTIIFSENGIKPQDEPGGNYIGGVVGYLDGGTISNVFVVNANIHGNHYIGGLVGYSDSSSQIFTNGVNEGSLSVKGNNNVGGVVGNNQGTIISSGIGQSSETHTIEGHKNIGGLVGKNSGKISYGFTLPITISGENNVGGLVGFNETDGEVMDGGVYGITVKGNKQVGGLVGNNKGSVTGISRSNPLSGGEKTVVEAKDVEKQGFNFGGLVGENHGKVEGTSSAIVLLSKSAFNVGGLVGYNSGQVIGLAAGKVSGQSNTGGLIGYNTSNSNNPGLVVGYVSTKVSNNTDNSSGGLVGKKDKGVIYGYWEITTTEQNNGIGDGRDDNDDVYGIMYTIVRKVDQNNKNSFQYFDGDAEGAEEIFNPNSNSNDRDNFFTAYFTIEDGNNFIPFLKSATEQIE